MSENSALRYWKNKGILPGVPGSEMLTVKYYRHIMSGLLKNSSHENTVFFPGKSESDILSISEAAETFQNVFRVKAGRKCSEPATLESFAVYLMEEYPLHRAWPKVSGRGPFSLWKNMQALAMTLDQHPYEAPDHTVYYKQAGVMKCLAIVVDFPDARAEDNDDLYGNRTPSGNKLMNARDYYDFIFEQASGLFQTVSYGKMKMECDLLSDPDTETGIIRMGKNLYPDYAFERDGDCDKYLSDEVFRKRVKDLISERPEIADKKYDTLYVVAVENAKGISYGPMNTDGRLANAITGKDNFGAFVRIGLDMFKTWGFKHCNHESTHALGTVDYYVGSYSGIRQGQADPVTGNMDIFQLSGDFDYMGNIKGKAPDLFAWGKWRLGWIDDSQVDFILENGTTEHILTPLGLPGGTKIVVVPSDTPGVNFVVEYRAKAGLDADTIPYSGLLMYKTDCSIRSLVGPLAVVNLHPEIAQIEEKGSLRAALDQSLLGSSTGILEYRDEAAGINIKVLSESDAEVKFTIEYANKKRTFSPTLSEARFIDHSTFELKTDYDLRGITPHEIILMNDGERIDSILINQVSSRTLRFTCRPVLKPGHVTVFTAATFFCGMSEAVTVTPYELLPAPKISDIRITNGRTVTMTVDTDISGIMKNAVRSKLPVASISFDKESMRLSIVFGEEIPSGFSILLKQFSDFDPASGDAAAAKFGAKAKTFEAVGNIQVSVS